MSYDIEPVGGDRRSSSLDIAELLREIRDSELDTQKFERQILASIKQLKSEHSKNDLSYEEHQFLKGLIAKKRAEAELRDAIKEYILKKASVTVLLAIAAGLLLLLKDYMTP